MLYKGRIRERYGMSEMDRIDDFVKQLQERLAQGRMTYDEVVIIDDLISVLARVRLRVCAVLANVRSTTGR